jgi:hypothetical protein
MHCCGCRSGHTSFETLPRWHKNLKTDIQVKTAHCSDVQFVFSDETRENVTVLKAFQAVKTKAINRNVVRGWETVLTERIFADIESARLTGNVAADLAQSGAAVLRKDADSGGRFASEETAVLNCKAAISTSQSQRFRSCEQAVGSLGFKLEPVANH